MYVSVVEDLTGNRKLQFGLGFGVSAADAIRRDRVKASRARSMVHPLPVLRTPSLNDYKEKRIMLSLVVNV